MAGDGISVADAKRVINTVVTILQNNDERRRAGGFLATLDISEVFKGGSMGKGTMVEGDFDADLVIYTTSIDLRTAARITGYEDCFKEIHSYLNNQLGRHYRVKVCSKFSLQFTCYGVSMDILLSPYFHNFQEYCNFLGTIDRSQLQLFSCSASKWQVQFIQSYPDKVIDYIKTVKEWRNTMWDDQGITEGRPKSYLIELLVVKAYDDCMQSVSSQMRSMGIVGATTPRATVSSASIRLQLIAMVTYYPRLAVYWTRYYTEDKIWRFQNRQPPYIIDPANPSNNVYKSGIGKDTYAGDHWKMFRRMIDTLQL